LPPRLATHKDTGAATTFPPLDGIKSGTARRLTCVEAALAWIILIVAGLFEIVWATAMKQSNGFTRLWPSLVTALALPISFGLLSWAMRSLPLGTAYTVWTGVGAVGAFAIGILALGEGAGPLRLLAAALIVGGLVLMKIARA
jgi:quaternary ammonium compound-resistance protein SugE